MSRRAFVQGGVAGILAAAGLTAYEIYQARYVSPFSPQLDRVEFAVPDGSEGLAGMKIAFVTDTHVGPFIEINDLYRALDLARAESPDLILLGGDYVSESPRYAPETAAAIGDLLSDAPLGGFGVIGNHDLSVSRTRVQEALVTVGIPVLRNQTTLVTYRGAQLAIAGIDETLLGDPQPAETIAQAPPGVPVLALWHEPEFAEQAAAAGAFAQLWGTPTAARFVSPGSDQWACPFTASATSSARAGPTACRSTPPAASAFTGRPPGSTARPRSRWSRSSHRLPDRYPVPA